jgi:hypothetical protein
MSESHRGMRCEPANNNKGRHPGELVVFLVGLSRSTYSVYQDNSSSTARRTSTTRRYRRIFGSRPTPAFRDSNVLRAGEGTGLPLSASSEVEGGGRVVVRRETTADRRK